jgi:hypothetical protein
LKKDAGHKGTLRCIKKQTNSRSFERKHIEVTPLKAKLAMRTQKQSRCRDEIKTRKHKARSAMCGWTNASKMH